MDQFVISIDQSTSGTKALLINKAGKISYQLSTSHKQHYPHAGWLEHDPNEIYNNSLSLIKQLLKDQNLTPKNIAFLSITNQRETALIWEKDQFETVYPAIVWQCRRTAEYCSSMKSYEEVVTKKTGLVIDPYFSATKWNWILNNVDVQGKQLLAGTVDSWLIYNLTKGNVHATDYTNASRTLLFNIHELNWDSELIELFALSSLRLPTVKTSDDFFGYIEVEELIEDEYKIPIFGVMGDSQAALFAQLCFEKGMAKATYGTGSSVLMNIGSSPILPTTKGLVLALGWKLKNDTTYALEGIIHSSGDTLKWARDNMSLYNSFDELSELTQSVPHSDGVYVVPGFNGLGAPYWNANAKACIVGISRSTTRAHILKACLDAISLQIHDVICLIEKEADAKVKELRADGGASKNSELMQLQADYLQSTVSVPKIAELSAFGATYAGALGSNYWTLEDIKAIYELENTYTYQMNETIREQKINGWNKAVADVNRQY